MKKKLEEKKGVFQKIKMRVFLRILGRETL